MSDGPAARRPAPARDRLLVAARELLSEMPVDRITVRTIAARAGVQHSLITHHYGSRADLLAAAIGTTLVTIAAAVADAPDVHTAVRETFNRVLHTPELAAAVNVVTSQDRTIEQREGFPIVEAFTAQLRTAGVPPARARARAATITNMIFLWMGMEDRWLRMGGHTDPVSGRYDYLQTLLELVDSAIDPPPHP